jgi:hypothetical protein
VQIWVLRSFGHDKCGGVPDIQNVEGIVIASSCHGTTRVKLAIRISRMQLHAAAPGNCISNTASAAGDAIPHVYLGPAG